MSSSPEDRLALVQASFKAAYRRREADLEAAAGQPALQKQIFDIVDGFELAYTRAANAALEASGPAIEAAYDAAKAAGAQVDQAYQEAKALPDRIRAASDALGAVTNLVDKASAAA